MAWPRAGALGLGAEIWGGLFLLVTWFKRELRDVKRYYRGILISLAIFFVSSGASYLLAVLLQDEVVAGYFDDVRRLVLAGGMPENIFLYIWARNALVSFTTLVLGILTYRVWPVFILTFNGAISGLVVKMMALSLNRHGLEIWLYGILPHGIPELGALFLACGASFYYQGLRARGKLAWGRVLGTYFLLVLPLLALAAAVETFITPLLINLFLF